MPKKIWKIARLISPGLIILLTIAARPGAAERTIQNRANLRIVVSGQKSSTNQPAPIAGADVLVRSDDGSFLVNPPTDSQGVASASDVPFGKTLIQVTMPGWITDGQTYELNQKEQTIEIKLKPSEGAPTPTPTPTPTATPDARSRDL
jgi:hypothetical protein